jgi:hypothetical protein
VKFFEKSFKDGLNQRWNKHTRANHTHPTILRRIGYANISPQPSPRQLRRLRRCGEGKTFPALAGIMPPAAQREKTATPTKINPKTTTPTHMAF